MFQLEIDFDLAPPCPGPPVTLPAIIAPTEAARLVGFDVDHVYYLIRFCRIEAAKVRGQWRIFGPSLEAYAYRRSA